MTTPQCPFSVDAGVLVVVYDGVLMAHCFRALGWSLPVNIVDIHIESRVATNGVIKPDDISIDLMLNICGLKHAAAGMPQLNTIKHIELLFDRLVQQSVCLERALYRASYTPVCTEIERVGIPIDVDLYNRLKQNLPSILNSIIADVDEQYHIYDGPHLNPDKFRQYLNKCGLPVHYDKYEQIDVSYDTIKMLSKSYSLLTPIKEVEWLINQLKINELAIGADGRNRSSIRPYRATTGRNQPKTSQNIVCWSGFMRRLIKPGPGRAIAEIDFKNEEFGIGAALSSDGNMIAAYNSDDVYIEFAKQCGVNMASIDGADRVSVRDRYKMALLAIGYGIGNASLARRLGIPLPYAREIIEQHHRIYPTYWDWSEAAVDYGTYYGVLRTRQGWPLHITEDMTPESIRNFPLQAHGSEIIRLSCALAQDRGVIICMPIHDALLIESRVRDINDAALTAKLAMEDASEQILGGFILEAKVKNICTYPNAFNPDKGYDVWNRITKKLKHLI